MILPDVNLLIYAHDPDAPKHPLALEWWDRCLAGPEPVGLAWVTVLGFVRLLTSRRVFANAQPPDEVLSRVKEWLTLPHLSLVHPSRSHFDRFSELIHRLGTAGNLTTDIHLAVLAMEHGYRLHSTDADFSRIPGLTWINPLS